MANSETLQALKKELAETRAAGMAATRAGDFMKVARMTAAAARINKQILDIEGEIEARRVGANPNEARR